MYTTIPLKNATSITLKNYTSIKKLTELIFKEH